MHSVLATGGDVTGASVTGENDTGDDVMGDCSIGATEGNTVGVLVSALEGDKDKSLQHTSPGYPLPARKQLS